MAKLCKAHKQAAKRTLCYLRTTQAYALTYYYDPTTPISIYGYVDANWAGDDPRCFSTGGYVFNLAGAPISWQTKCQSSIAQSSTQTEYIAAALASREALWLSELISEFMLPFDVSDEPLILYCDNQSTITLAESPSFPSKLKHVKISHHFLKELVQEHFLQLLYVRSGENWADFLTKSVPAAKLLPRAAPSVLYPLGALLLEGGSFRDFGFWIYEILNVQVCFSSLHFVQGVAHPSGGL
ncbi:hypothetical protein L7F22_064087 [Adiantum nelumboides]|nr:hypothetical protein [Adiantum nelumboides]